MRRASQLDSRRPGSIGWASAAPLAPLALDPIVRCVAGSVAEGGSTCGVAGSALTCRTPPASEARLPLRKCSTRVALNFTSASSTEIGIENSFSLVGDARSDSLLVGGVVVGASGVGDAIAETGRTLPLQLLRRLLLLLLGLLPLTDVSALVGVWGFSKLEIRTKLGGSDPDCARRRRATKSDSASAKRRTTARGTRTMMSTRSQPVLRSSLMQRGSCRTTDEQSG
jgi:hypothetical protein